MASRLAGGRTLLAKRLTRYGLCLTAASVAHELARGAVSDGIPGPLKASIVKAAATVAAGQQVANVMSAKVVALTERVVRTMLIAKLKTLTPVLLVTVVLGGGGVLWSYSTVKAQQKSITAAPTQIAQAQEEKQKSDKDLILGTWIPVSGEQNGEKIPKEKLATKLVITKDKFTLHLPEGERRTPEWAYTIDPEKNPKELDLTFGNKTYMGIYELKGTTLKHVGMERGRPSDFSSTGATLVTYERQKADHEKAQAGPATPVAARDEKPKSDKELLQGTWIPVSGEQNGKKIPNDFDTLVFTQDKFAWHGTRGDVREGTYTIDAEKKPKEIDFAWGDNKTVQGIYELKGTTLKFCGMERGRPSDFDSTNASLLIYEKQNAKKEKTRTAPSTPAAARDERPKSDKELILGTWIPVSVEQNGKKVPKERWQTKTVITKDKITHHEAGGMTVEYTYTIDPEKKPKELDITRENTTYMGIYELKGTTLKHVGMERGRPSDFDSTNARLVTYEREKKADK